VLAMAVQNLLDERVDAEEVAGRRCHVFHLRCGTGGSGSSPCGQGCLTVAALSRVNPLQRNATPSAIGSPEARLISVHTDMLIGNRPRQVLATRSHSHPLGGPGGAAGY
jgi:hypothetical protein